MAATLAISEFITTLAEAESTFNLRSTYDLSFFTEWQEPVPELVDAEKARLDLIKQRYLYHRKYGPLAEGTVNFIVMAPLLEMAGFYDPPFRIQSEVSVKVEVEAESEVLRGRIDTLVILNRLWVLLIESKQAAFNVDMAIPQAIAYMMTNPYPESPAFGLVSNGGQFMFLKLVKQEAPRYALSDDFSLYRQRNELFAVLSVLRHIGRLTQ